MEVVHFGHWHSIVMFFHVCVVEYNCTEGEGIPVSCLKRRGMNKGLPSCCELRLQQGLIRSHGTVSLSFDYPFSCPSVSASVPIPSLNLI